MSIGYFPIQYLLKQNVNTLGGSRNSEGVLWTNYHQ